MPLCLLFMLKNKITHNACPQRIYTLAYWWEEMSKSVVTRWQCNFKGLYTHRGNKEKGHLTDLEVREDFLEKSKVEFECEYYYLFVFGEPGKWARWRKGVFSRPDSGTGSLAIPLVTCPSVIYLNSYLENEDDTICHKSFESFIHGNLLKTLLDIKKNQLGFNYCWALTAIEVCLCSLSQSHLPQPKLSAGAGSSRDRPAHWASVVARRSPSTQKGRTTTCPPTAMVASFSLQLQQVQVDGTDSDSHGRPAHWRLL